MEISGTISERVKARLVRGDYETYAQIAKEEGTTEQNVNKIAYNLRKEGVILEDRRTSKARQQIDITKFSNIDVSGSFKVENKDSTPSSDDAHAKLMETYEQKGVPKEDIQTMKLLRTDLDGLRRINHQVNTYRYDKVLEKIRSKFDSLEKLEELDQFFTAVKNHDITQSQFESVMSKIQQIFELFSTVNKLRKEKQHYQEEIEELIVTRSEQKTEIQNLNNQIQDKKENVRSLEKYIQELASKKDKMGTVLASDFDRIKQIARKESDTIIQTEEIYQLVIGATLNAAIKKRTIFNELALAYYAGGADAAYLKSRVDEVYDEVLDNLGELLCERTTNKFQKETDYYPKV